MNWEISGFTGVAGADAIRNLSASGPANAGAEASPVNTSARGESLVLLSPRVGKAAERLGELDNFNGVARTVRSADRAMAQVVDLIARIKEALTHIVKQYPPYGLDSRERIDYLNSIAGLRKQIEAVSPDSVLLGQAALSFPSGEHYTLDLAAFRVGSLDIPDLGLRASDVEVANALDDVTSTEARLRTSRGALADAVRSATAASLPQFPGLRT